MTDDDLLFVLLGVFYLWECLQWAPPGSVAARRSFGRAFRLTEGVIDFENRLGVPFVGLPLPPLGVLHLSTPWPFSISPRGITTHLRASWLTKGRVRDRGAAVTLAEIDGVSADGRNLSVDGKPFARCATVRVARRFRDLLVAAAEAVESERHTIIDRELERYCDPIRARARLDESAATRRKLWVVTNVLFVHILVAVPLTVHLRGWKETWPALLGALLILQLATTFLFARTHARLFPDGAGERWSTALTMAVFTPLALRARDQIDAELGCEFHPLALVAALGCAEETSRFAAQLARDRAHPVPTVHPPGEGALAIAAWFDDRQAAMLGALLPASPAPSSAAIDPYCPRCLEELRPGVPVCPDCRIATRAAVED